MARRTKAEALQTRHALLDAAEILFLAQGVSRTSLAGIAAQAGTTRGAIYWHFKDKADLFNAMMDRVTLPFEDALKNAAAADGSHDDPIQRVYRVIRDALHQTVHDEQTRRVFEIAIHKVEHIEELRAISERRLAIMRKLVAMTEQAMSASAIKRDTVLPMPADTAALGLHMMLDGLINLWLLAPAAFDLETTGHLTMVNYLRGLGLELVGESPAATPST